MVVRSSSSAARIAGRIRLALLTLVALLLAHEAVYAVHFGLGHGYAEAMTEGGHDGYWPAFTTLAAAAAAILLGGSALRYARLRWLVARGRVAAPAVDAGPGYVHELARLWAGLWVSVTVLFLVQENVEHLSTGGALAGFEPIAAAGNRLAIPILAAITLALAAIGALVRWRLAVLEARVGRLRRRFDVRSAPLAPAREWADVGAGAPLRWILGRPDAGRAPPRTLPA